VRPLDVRQRPPGTPDDKVLADRLGAVKWFAEEIVAKV
jgi:hypothetical protein